MANFTGNTNELNSKLGKYSLPLTAPGVPNKPAFVLATFGLGQLQKALFNNQSIETDEEVRKSKLNTPIYKFADVRLNSGDVEILLDTTLAEISQSKNIITTTIQGRSGTVKEYISDGDFEIRLRGIVDSGEIHVYPEEQINTLIELCSIQDSISITSPFIQLFGVSEVVVTNYSLFQIPGLYNSQAFEITLLSDTPLNLQPLDA